MDEEGRGRQKEDESSSRHLHRKHLGMLSIKAATLIDFLLFSTSISLPLHFFPLQNVSWCQPYAFYYLFFFSSIFRLTSHINGHCHSGHPQTDTKVKCHSWPYYLPALQSLVYVIFRLLLTHWVHLGCLPISHPNAQTQTCISVSAPVAAIIYADKLSPSLCCWQRKMKSVVYLVIFSTCFQLCGNLCATLIKIMQTFLFEDVFSQSLICQLVVQNKGVCM